MYSTRGNTLTYTYRYIAIFATAIQYNMTETGLRIAKYCVVAVTSLLVIKFLGGQLVEVGTYIVAAYFYKSDYMYL